jgi:valyl-tRNA synthetase
MISFPWEGDARVFDTWFDSSITPLYVLNYPYDTAFFNRNMPCSLRPQGKEIIRTWLYYTLLKTHLLTRKTIFRDVWINYHVVDEKGYKMSKSKGNIIDPHDIITKHGAEAFRLWTAIEGNLDRTDFRCSFERIEGAHKTLVKLWNASRFISQFEDDQGDELLNDLDMWIRQELNGIVSYSRDCYSRYDFHNPAKKIKHFVWETFASHYIELVKSRAYNRDGRFSAEEQNAAIRTLRHCLGTVLKLWHPVIPFLTYRVYMTLFSEEIDIADFPNEVKTGRVPFSTEEIIELNAEIWKSKRDHKLSLKDPLEKYTVSRKFKSIEKDITATHNILDVSYSG